MTHQQLRILNALIGMGGEAASKFKLAVEAEMDFHNTSKAVDELERGGQVSVEGGGPRGSKRIIIRIRLLV